MIARAVELPRGPPLVLLTTTTPVADTSHPATVILSPDTNFVCLDLVILVLDQSDRILILNFVKKNNLLHAVRNNKLLGQTKNVIFPNALRIRPEFRLVTCSCMALFDVTVVLSIFLIDARDWRMRCHNKHNAETTICAVFLSN